MITLFTALGKQPNSVGFMKRIEHVAYYLAIGALFTHELDAVANHEWRVLPVTSFLSDQIGYFVFVAAHVPIFAAVLACVANRSEKIRNITKVTICVILIVHSFLHAAYMGHPNYEFHTHLSNSLIFGGGLLGTVALACHLILRRKQVA